MFLALLTSGLTFAGYVLYWTQIYSGSAGPNPTSWTIWALFSLLNVWSFWKVSGDYLLGGQYIVGSLMCNSIFLYSLFASKFVPLDQNGIIMLGFGVVICFVWFIKRSAAYATIGIALITLYSFYPTIRGVMADPMLERSFLPWFFWTLASIATLTNVIMRWKGKKAALAVPIACILCYGSMTLLTMK